MFASNVVFVMIGTLSTWIEDCRLRSERKEKALAQQNKIKELSELRKRIQQTTIEAVE